MFPMFPKAIFLVLPNQFAIAIESSADNTYMQLGATNPDLALRQSLNLVEQLRNHGHSVICFPGLQSAPDGVFPNNVYATIPGRVVVGAMRHPVRQIETQRADLRAFFGSVLGYELVDLSTLTAKNDYAELTGSVVIDRVNRIGFCGLGERCTVAGANAMQAAFDLPYFQTFPLANGEYHANVIMSSLAGRGLMLCRAGFAQPADADRAAACYAPENVVWIDAAEKASFVGNCIALAPDQLWMSGKAQAGMKQATRKAIQALGFKVISVDLSEIEKAGGSLRCMIGEIY